MIIIKDLVKKYRSKNRRICKALDHVSLTLPDTGMVFIIGKSGSGKSTLLNMIGGLDGFNAGKIIADGNDISKFRPGDFYKYRASYASFIFQDYHLIDELTVEENVRLALELEGEEKKEIGPALSAVDLEGYEGRYPDELSGGQKQRVAIARALIKSPKVILCDEPTGNLDKNTSTQILNLLKEISKERLVLIVSHNMPDAEKYGDRIIELADGKIISDLSRKAGYTNKLEIKGGTLTLPYNHNLTDEEIALLNREGEGIKKYQQNDGGYELTESISENGRRVSLKPSKMKHSTTRKLFFAFTKRGAIRSATTAFISAMMLVLLIIFQSFLSFDGGKVIADSLKEQGTSTLVLKKNTHFDEYGNITKTRLYEVTDEDLSKIDSISGEGTKKHLLYSYSLRIYDNNPTIMIEGEKEFYYTFEHSSIFSPQMAGTLVCDDEYLVNKFGQNGEIKLLAGDLEAARSSYGIIITDYLADAMILNNPIYYRSYESIIGPVYLNNYFLYGHVAAIIDTGYKTKYKDVIEEVAENKYKDTPGISTLDEETAIAIMDDIKCNLSIGYSLNPNFENAIMTVDARNFSALGDTIVSSPDSSATYTIVHGPVYFDPTDNLKKGEILLDQYIANVLFPGGIPEAPFKIKLEKYQYPDKGGEITIDKEFTVVGVINRSVTGFGGYSCISAEDLLEIRGADVVPYAVYLENFTNSDTLIDEMAKSYFSWNSTSGTAVTLLNQSVSMFYDLFSLFEILLVILIVVFLASYSIRNIKSNYYQIGVIKAIGGRSSDISRIYTAQTTILTIIVCILTYFGAYYLVGVANDILIESFMSITNVSIGTINIIEFDIKIVISTMITTFLLSMLSTIVPLMTLHGIKPINIIKAKE